MATERTATDVEFELSAEARKPEPDAEKMEALNAERRTLLDAEAERLRNLKLPE